jgi:hypothetical protein
MIQLQQPAAPQDTSVQGVLRSVDWRNLLQWADVFRVVAVIIVAILLYRLIRGLIHRLVNRQIDEDDPLVRRPRTMKRNARGNRSS